MNPDTAHPPSLLLASIPWGICLLYMLLAGGGLYRVFRRLKGSWGKVLPLLGGSLQARLVSFVLASLLFPALLPELAVQLVKLLWSLVIFGPLQVASTVSTEGSASGVVVNTVLALVSALTQAARSSVGSIPGMELVYLLLLWGLLGQLLSQSPDTQKTRLQHLVDTFGVARLKNSATLVLLGLGLYLCIASILAVTTQGQPVVSNEAISPDTLRGNLQAFQLTQAQLDAMSPLPSTDAFLSLRDGIKQHETSPASQTAPDSKGSIQTVVAGGLPPQNSAPALVGLALLMQEAKTELYIMDSSLEQLQSTWKAAVRNVQEMQAFEFNRTLHVFVTDGAGSKSERETIQHFSELSAWYSHLISQNRGALSNCANSLQAASSTLVGYSLEQRHLLESSAVQGAAVKPETGRMRLDMDGIKKNCMLILPDKPPRRSATGKFLGTLEPYFRWLIALESMPLALIVGMLGFGLLGSLISTSVRERASTGKDTLQRELIVEDLAGALIRGISATVVIYLSVAGGLAIFTRSASDPNPHVLLFVCFVAAVFSEDVWEWAHIQLKERLSKSSPPEGSKGRGEGEAGDGSGGGSAPGGAP